MWKAKISFLMIHIFCSGEVITWDNSGCSPLAPVSVQGSRDQLSACSGPGRSPAHLEKSLKTKKEEEILDSHFHAI